MSTSVIDPQLLDLEISVAGIALSAARGLWTHCPSSENERRVQEAMADLDALLDQRLAKA
jgi:hypothetical protein